MKIDRRSVLKAAGLIPLLRAETNLVPAAAQSSAGKPDYTIRIATGLAELASEHIVSTTLCNGQFPGPLIRFREGQSVVVDIHNEADTPELVHWHAQMIPSDVDGSSEGRNALCPRTRDASDLVCAETRRLPLLPYSHTVGLGDLNRGTYSLNGVFEVRAPQPGASHEVTRAV